MTKWVSTLNPMFRNSFAEDIFYQKYSHQGAETWGELATTLVEDVCSNYFTKDEKAQLTQYIKDLKFIPGGRYLYYAGRRKKFFNNCYLLRAEEDSREDWADLSKRTELCLSTGGGVGVDYSVYRPSGSKLTSTGGIASGPLAKMQMINELGRCIMQGGSRRSALYASLSWKHGDILGFMAMKDWYHMPVAGTGGRSIGQLKEADFNFTAPMDMTNISVNYDTSWLMNYWETGDVGETFTQNCRQALSTGEPGFSFNFFDKENETLRNACTEVTSSDDSDVCNLGSINLGRVDSITEFIDVVSLASRFLYCGTIVADVPYSKVTEVKSRNRRLGLGLMGIHEWLIRKGGHYEVTEELHRWLAAYRDISKYAANTFADKLGLGRPAAYRAIAPTGSIGILAGTTTGIEPIFATAYKRRYLKGQKWHYQYVIDSAARDLSERYGKEPASMESALDLAKNPEKRIKFQADVQDYVDMSISSTINLPRWGSDDNNDTKVGDFASILATYSHRLRGCTVYPDGARGGQPLVSVPYADAVRKLGVELEEHVETMDVCDLTLGGTCGA